MGIQHRLQVMIPDLLDCCFLLLLHYVTVCMSGSHHKERQCLPGDLSLLQDASGKTPLNNSFLLHAIMHMAPCTLSLSLYPHLYVCLHGAGVTPVMSEEEAAELQAAQKGSRLAASGRLKK
jgi:hypothetical protein